MDKLFKPFGYIDDGQQLNTKGIGLGLNISQQIVNMLGGRIILSSVYGSGTIFKFAVNISQSMNVKMNNIVNKI